MEINIVNYVEVIFFCLDVYMNICCNRYSFCFCMIFCIFFLILVFFLSDDRKVEIFICYLIFGIIILNIVKFFF